MEWSVAGRVWKPLKRRGAFGQGNEKKPSDKVAATGNRSGPSIVGCQSEIHSVSANLADCLVFFDETLADVYGTGGEVRMGRDALGEGTRVAPGSRNRRGRANVEGRDARCPGGRADRAHEGAADRAGRQAGQEDLLTRTTESRKKELSRGRKPQPRAAWHQRYEWAAEMSRP